MELVDRQFCALLTSPEAWQMGGVIVERHNKFVTIGESRRVEEMPTLDETRAAVDGIVYCVLQ